MAFGIDLAVSAARLDPHDAKSARVLAACLAALLADEQLFVNRLVIYSEFRPTS